MGNVPPHIKEPNGENLQLKVNSGIHKNGQQTIARKNTQETDNLQYIQILVQIP